MKKQLALFIFVAAALVAAPSVARADLGTSWLGADFELLPSGSWKGTFPTPIGTADFSGDTESAYAIGGLIEEQGNGLLSVGLAPRYIFNVKGKGSSGDAATQLDLRA